jgi:hypothetical protein
MEEAYFANVARLSNGAVRDDETLTAWATAHGFTGNGDEMPALTAEWKRIITERRKASGRAATTTATPPAVTPKLGPSGKPVRRGRWTFVSHPGNGDVWRLDGTTLDLEHDPDCHACCVGGRCNGAWILYEDGRYREPVAEYLSPVAKNSSENFNTLT